mmetsp:Transcript_16730/g.49951  ORF Transcript_16730/g.49951 Transcript_16730/m.49951 type:complete len:105 (+) Transcript_16730:100-414(+)
MIPPRIDKDAPAPAAKSRFAYAEAQAAKKFDTDPSLRGRRHVGNRVIERELSSDSLSSLESAAEAAERARANWKRSINTVIATLRFARIDSCDVAERDEVTPKE